MGTVAASLLSANGRATFFKMSSTEVTHARDQELSVPLSGYRHGQTEMRIFLPINGGKMSPFGLSRPLGIRFMTCGASQPELAFNLVRRVRDILHVR